MIEEKLKEACNIVIGQLILLYEPLWELPGVRSVSHRHFVGGRYQCFISILDIDIVLVSSQCILVCHFCG